MYNANNSQGTWPARSARAMRTDLERMLTRNNGGENMSNCSTMTNDTFELTKIGTKPFTIVSIWDSTHEGIPCVSIITQKPIKKKGKKYSEFYTSNRAIINTLSDVQLRKEVQMRPLGPLKCKLTKIKEGGKDDWILVDALWHCLDLSQKHRAHNIEFMIRSICNELDQKKKCSPEIMEENFQ